MKITLLDLNIHIIINRLCNWSCYSAVDWGRDQVLTRTLHPSFRMPRMIIYRNSIVCLWNQVVFVGHSPIRLPERLSPTGIRSWIHIRHTSSISIVLHSPKWTIFYHWWKEWIIFSNRSFICVFDPPSPLLVWGTMIDLAQIRHRKFQNDSRRDTSVKIWRTISHAKPIRVGRRRSVIFPVCTIAL